MKKIITMTAVVGLMMSCAVAHAAEGYKAQTCMACHNGKTAPDLKVLPSNDISAKLKTIKGSGMLGDKPVSPMMASVAKGLTDDDITRLANEIGKK